VFCLAIFRQRALDARTSTLQTNRRDIVSIEGKDVPNRSWHTGKLCEGNGGENEGRSGERGEIAREVCDATADEIDEVVKKRCKSMGPTI